jgi:hypothetical protein
MKTKSLKINEDLHKELKLYCVEKNTNLYNFVEKILKEKITQLKNDNN